MTNSKSFFEDLENSEEFLVESAKFHFAMELKRMMEEANLKNAALAKLLDVKPPMITKLLRGDANLTIETMVRACRSVGGRLFLKIAREQCDGRYIEVAKKSFAAYRLSQHDATQRASARENGHPWPIPTSQAMETNETKSIAA